MVHMYLQLVVVFSTNVMLHNQVSVERIELLIAGHRSGTEVSLLWTRPSIDIHSDLRHGLADDLQELCVRPISCGIMCAKPIDTELVLVALKTWVVIQVPES